MQHRSGHASRRRSADNTCGRIRSVRIPHPSTPADFVDSRHTHLPPLLHAVPCCAVFTVVQAAILSTMPAALTSRNAVWQKNALKQLQWVLRMRQAFGEPVVQKLAEAGILTALVQLLQPGTDACEQSWAATSRQTACTVQQLLCFYGPCDLCAKTAAAERVQLCRSCPLQWC